MKRINISRIQNQLEKLIGKHRNYKNFSRNKTKAYAYTKLIGVRVCPYCNINYTYTVMGCIRPDLDHFEAQSIVSGASLDPDNLVPSCQVCNSRLKRDQAFKLTTHIHPFHDDFDSIKRFGILLNSSDYLNPDNLEICFFRRKGSSSDDNFRADKSIGVFKLIMRYKEHRNEVVDIFKILKFYHQARRREINDLLGEPRSIANLLSRGGNCDINQVSLGKLKQDLIRSYK